MKRGIFILIPLLMVAAFVMGQDFTVDYVDGILDVSDGGSWYELYIGDPVEGSDTVRLGRDSYAELSDGVTTIKLTRAGTYRIGELSASARRTESSGIGGLVLGRVGRLTGQATQQEQTTQGGVRASEAVNQNQPTWAGGESVDELIQNGLGLLNQGEFQDAYWVFQEAYDYALDDTEYAKSLFYYGYGAALIGSTGEAFELLEEVGPNPDTDYFEDHVIVLGQLLLESFAYEDAIEYLVLLADDPGAERGAQQSALLLTGLAYDGIGNVTLARRYLERSRDAVPGSEGARIAEDLLRQL
jgi:tetratricopeptide (TPR) repeat protein